MYTYRLYWNESDNDWYLASAQSDDDDSGGDDTLLRMAVTLAVMSRTSGRRRRWRRCRTAVPCGYRRVHGRPVDGAQPANADPL
ncbi:autotransporter outer membrane beta-barrel domain-containing protein [Salmonella enterica subsp. enterica]|nr:autotransporter outer membrane beta-barrel domain-containing protein [Salmonella enterica subsp. enterica]